MTRGTLRIYLGAAPGVGKTYAMLGEGRRRAERGTDVVVGYVDTHGRPRTAAQLGDLPVVAHRRIDHEGVVVEEMNLDALLARRPQVALVGELGHTNAAGSRNAKRWEDVEELLEAGIDVISAGRSAGGRLPRPADAAGEHQSLRHEPAGGRRRLAGRGHHRVLPHDRRGDRPAHRAGRQPPRHEPAPGRGGVAPPPAGGGGGDRAGRPLQPR